MTLAATSGADLATAWGTCIAAGATLLAVIVSLWLSDKSGRDQRAHNRAQFEIEHLINAIQNVADPMRTVVTDNSARIALEALPQSVAPLTRAYLSMNVSQDATDAWTTLVQTTPHPAELQDVVVDELRQELAKRAEL